jgi:hypothetical protein
MVPIEGQMQMAAETGSSCPFQACHTGCTRLVNPPCVLLTSDLLHSGLCSRVSGVL